MQLCEALSHRILQHMRLVHRSNRAACSCIFSAICGRAASMSAIQSSGQVQARRAPVERLLAPCERRARLRLFKVSRRPRTWRRGVRWARAKTQTAKGAAAVGGSSNGSRSALILVAFPNMRRRALSGYRARQQAPRTDDAGRRSGNASMMERFTAGFCCLYA